MVRKLPAHSKQINDIQASIYCTMVITASKDNSAKVRHFCSLYTVVGLVSEFYLLNVLSRIIKLSLPAFIVNARTLTVSTFRFVFEILET